MIVSTEFDFLHNNPHYYGLAISIAGIWVLIGAIRNTSLICALFDEESKPFRIIVGIIGIAVIIFGIYWFFTYKPIDDLIIWSRVGDKRHEAAL